MFVGFFFSCSSFLLPWLRAKDTTVNLNPSKITKNEVQQERLSNQMILLGEKNLVKNVLFGEIIYYLTEMKSRKIGLLVVDDDLNV